MATLRTVHAPHSCQQPPARWLKRSTNSPFSYIPKKVTFLIAVIRKNSPISTNLNEFAVFLHPFKMTTHTKSGHSSRLFRGLKADLPRVRDIYEVFFK